MLRIGIEGEAFAAVDGMCFPRGWAVNAYQADDIHWGAGIYVKEQCVAYLYASLIVGESELLRIACLPEHRGCGHAITLMDAYLAEVPAERYFLEVSHVNHPAIKLYRRYGYQQIGQRDHYYGQDEHALLLQRISP